MKRERVKAFFCCAFFALISLLSASLILGTENSNYGKAESYPMDDGYTVTVIGGKIDGTETSITVPEGTTIVFTPDLPDGMVFSGWKDSAGALLSGDETYSLEINADITVIAHAINNRANPFLVRTDTELMNLGNAAFTNGVDSLGNAAAYTQDGYYEIANDINIDSGYNPADIVFQGKLDGKNHTIRYTSAINITTATQYFGIIRSATKVDTTEPVEDYNIEIKNIRIKDFKFVSTGDPARSYLDYVGALVGATRNTIIENCHITGGYVMGRSVVGGLVGIAYVGSVIRNCSSNTEVRNSEVLTMAQEPGFGGLVGHAYSGSYMYDSYATGDVYGSVGVGGLIGASRHAHVERCFATGNVYASIRYAGGLIGFIKFIATESSANGYTEIYIGNSYATGNVLLESEYIVGHQYNGIGGLIGGFNVGYQTHKITIENCFAAPDRLEVVALSTPSYSLNIGGLIGSIENVNTRMTISNCFSSVNEYAASHTSTKHAILAKFNNISNRTLSGKFYVTAPDDVLWNLGAAFTKLENREALKSPEVYSDAGLNWDFENVWKFDNALNNGLPSLQTIVIFADEYTILVSGGTISGTNEDNITISAGQSIILIADTPLEGYYFAGWKKNGEAGYVSTDATYDFTPQESASYNAEFLKNFYNIDYNLNGGNSNGGNQLTYTEDDLPLPLLNAAGDQTREFKEWTLNGLVVTSIPAGTTGDITLEAVWYMLYNVTVSNGTIAGESGSTATIRENAEVTVIADAAPDITKTFKGWYENGSRVSADKEYTFILTASRDLTAEYMNIYLISYELEGGENHPDNPGTYTEESGTISLKDPSREGYRFDGWFRGNILVISVDPSWAEDITLTARWTAIYTITVIGGSGSGSYAAGEAVEISASEATKGRRFAGWKKDGIIDNLLTEELFNITVSANAEYEAVFELIEYSVTYETGAGKNSSDNPQSYTIESGMIELSPAVLESYRFDGWFGNDNKVTHIDSSWAEDITLIAKWTAMYTITVSGGSGSGTYAENEVAIITANQAEPGKRFAGWKKNSAIDITLNQASMPVTVTGDASYEPVYEPIKYKITYELNEGRNNNNNPPELTYGDSFVLSEPSRDGYKFKGWYIGERRITELKAEELTSDITLVARWEKKQAAGMPWWAIMMIALSGVLLVGAVVVVVLTAGKKKKADREDDDSNENEAK